MAHRICIVVAARPNFIKLAPLLTALAPIPELEPVVVHTGQHYDSALNRQLFDELGIAPPDLELGIGSGTAAEQLGRTMLAFEPVLEDMRPAVVVVIGDVNATAACTVVARRAHVPVAHVEAGLRSGDEAMPEEINRLVTDRLATICYTPDAVAGANLRREGVAEERIVFVGNIMIDTLDAARAAADARNTVTRLGLGSQPFIVTTLHRPSNVDDPERLGTWMRLLCELARETSVVLPLHPRTRARLEATRQLRDLEATPGLHLLEPLGYHDLLHLQARAGLVITDSGGVQEECCVLGTPCLTVRTTTERPVTLREHGGTNELCGTDTDLVRRRARALLAHPERSPFRPPLWDGHTAARIAAHLRDWCAGAQ